MSDTFFRNSGLQIYARQEIIEPFVCVCILGISLVSVSPEEGLPGFPFLTIFEMLRAWQDSRFLHLIVRKLFSTGIHSDVQLFSLGCGLGLEVPEMDVCQKIVKIVI